MSERMQALVERGWAADPQVRPSAEEMAAVVAEELATLRANGPFTEAYQISVVAHKKRSMRTKRVAQVAGTGLGELRETLL